MHFAITKYSTFVGIVGGNLHRTLTKFFVDLTLDIEIVLKTIGLILQNGIFTG